MNQSTFRRRTTFLLLTLVAALIAPALVFYMLGVKLSCMPNSGVCLGRDYPFALPTLHAIVSALAGYTAWTIHVRLRFLGFSLGWSLLATLWTFGTLAIMFSLMTLTSGTGMNTDAHSLLLWASIPWSLPFVVALIVHIATICGRNASAGRQIAGQRMTIAATVATIFTMYSWHSIIAGLEKPLMLFPFFGYYIAAALAQPMALLSILYVHVLLYLSATSPGVGMFLLSNSGGALICAGLLLIFVCTLIGSHANWQRPDDDHAHNDPK